MQYARHRAPVSGYIGEVFQGRPMNIKTDVLPSGNNVMFVIVHLLPAWYYVS
ncbi:hypothetical protein EBL_c36570 [Shimwellia blattae DSM 4481 = NBRC 105725]|uniref:Uncharacterized protein n=1 Tax=Shimwellia blattae (strain ATCC 29907 / DSM 4481 / JCM 1650 / NBRC 105725 / CDC 9005-74) TaxID=630626 RepID=I2BDV4_SHIBC|nr:hypothetical protein EBL_c36570 [Shimwellia blattae DSM 4481 = NBRC 105725]